MHHDLARAMREATELTRARKLMDATRIIQEALSGRGAGGKAASPTPPQDDRTERAFCCLRVPRRERPAEAQRTPIESSSPESWVRG